MQVHVQRRSTDERRIEQLQDAAVVCAELVGGDTLTHSPGWSFIHQRGVRRIEAIDSAVRRGQGRMTTRELDILLSERSTIEKFLLLPVKTVESWVTHETTRRQKERTGG